MQREERGCVTSLGEDHKNRGEATGGGDATKGRRGDERRNKERTTRTEAKSMGVAGWVTTIFPKVTTGRRRDEQRRGGGHGSRGKAAGGGRMETTISLKAMGEETGKATRGDAARGGEWQLKGQEKRWEVAQGEARTTEHTQTHLRWLDG